MRFLKIFSRFNKVFKAKKSRKLVFGSKKMRHPKKRSTKNLREMR